MFMEMVFFEKTGEIRRTREELEQKLNVKIDLKGRKAEITGETFDEYQASIILEAISFGFSTKKALLLTEEGMVFIKIPIKNYTRRKNLKEVRARVIGREGKTKRTIEQVSGCSLVINENEVGVIGLAEDVEEAKTALASLIKGTKEGNVYKYLENLNADRKKREYFEKNIKKKPKF